MAILTNDWANKMASALTALSDFEWQLNGDVFDSRCPSFTLITGEGYLLHFREDTKKECVRIQAVYRVGHDCLNYRGEIFPTNQSLAKSFDSIAKQVIKKIFPYYIPTMEKLMAEYYKWKALEAKQAENSQRVKEIVKKTSWGSENNFRYVTDTLYEIEIDFDDTIKVTLKLPTDQALELIKQHC